MAETKKSSWRSIKYKLTRANEHLAEIAKINERFSTVKCDVVFEKDHDKNIGYFVVHLPSPPMEVSTIIGDCLHNLRSVLDYIVWQLVLSNPPNTPSHRNMFPICDTPKEFASQKKRGRLMGVPDEAVAVIENLQPYDKPHHSLALLNKLYNADKHRDLNYTLSVASDLGISYSRNGVVFLQTFLGNDEVYDGAILGNVGMRLDRVQLLPDVQIDSDARAFIAFQDYVSEWDEALDIVTTLYDIKDFITNEVINALEEFIP